jgi:hypothetical protein
MIPCPQVPGPPAAAWLADFSAMAAATPSTLQSAAVTTARPAWDNGERYVVAVDNDARNAVSYWAGVCPTTGLLIWTHTRTEALAFAYPLTADVFACAIAVAKPVRLANVRVERVG